MVLSALGWIGVYLKGFGCISSPFKKFLNCRYCTVESRTETMRLVLQCCEIYLCWLIINETENEKPQNFWGKYSLKTKKTMFLRDRSVACLKNAQKSLGYSSGG